jgi:hypothetical protein
MEGTRRRPHCCGPVDEWGGPRPQVRDGEGRSVLHLAATRGDSLLCRTLCAVRTREIGRLIFARTVCQESEKGMTSGTKRRMEHQVLFDLVPALQLQNALRIGSERTSVGALGAAERWPIWLETASVPALWCSVRCGRSAHPRMPPVDSSFPYGTCGIVAGWVMEDAVRHRPMLLNGAPSGWRICRWMRYASSRCWVTSAGTGRW